MESCAARRGTEAGFLLVEAVIAVALIAVCAGAALAAAVAVTHATARALPTSSLSLTAQNILTDLRAATVYDAVQLKALAGRSASFDVSEPGPNGSTRIVHIVASVSRSAVTDVYVASITALEANAAAVTLQARLVQEAPAPGSVLPASTPAPADLSRSAGADDPGRIQL